MKVKEISFILNQAKRFKSTIRAQLTFAGNKYTYQTGISIPTSEWHNGKTNSKAINMKLAAIEAAITNTILYYERLFQTPTQEEFRNKVDAFLQGDNAATILKKDRSLFVFIEKYIEESKATKSEETIKGYRTAYNKLREFLKNDVSFDVITLDFEKRFKKWLLSQKYSRNYIGTLIKNICVFMSEAHNVKRLHTNEDYKRFKVEQETADAIYLSIEELYKIHNLTITESLVKEYYPQSDNPKFHVYEQNIQSIKQSLIKVKNKFLIGAVCAMRISDYNRINTDYIKNDVISIMPKKGSSLRKPEPIKIPLHPIMKEILASGFDINEKIVEQNLNRQIKIICKMAGITEMITHYRTQGGMLMELHTPKYNLVSSHTARRSGATNMRLAGVPDHLIQVCTGHKTLAQLLKYIKAAYKEDNVKELLKYSYFQATNVSENKNEILLYVQHVLDSNLSPKWLEMLREDMGKDNLI